MKVEGRWVGIALLLATATLWSLAGVAVKVAGVEPLAFTSLRSVGAALIMLPLLGFGATLTGSARPAARLMWPTALCYTVMVGAFIVASAVGTAAEAILLQYSAPAWAAVMAWGLLGRRITRVQLAALGCAAAGVGVLLFHLWSEDRPSGPLAPALALLSGVGYAGVIVGLDAVDLDARRRTGGPVNVAAVVLWNNALAAAVLLPWAGRRGELSLSAATVAGLLALGVLQMALPYVLFQLGLRRVGPVAAGLILLIEPVLNPLWAYLGAGERPPPGSYLGGGLIVAAVAITVLAGRRRRLPPT
ncbi:putative inner membrane transporter yiJE [Alienimonas californiensis]|uniref:Putative inner membrane transporter yiJE n=1 Tax=Alienimonas californiensis TaxID=2527989 RepID=A0A517PEA2_9PLAN|nr:putative inner membrane transporter yiJE [Alienimonas californiensis]